MIVNQLTEQIAFTTADGSTIRSLLDLTNAPVVNQSIAEASLVPGGATDRHYHRVSEEIYFILEGAASMEINGEVREVGPGDAILIAPGDWHRIRSLGPEKLRFLCCCAPSYSHNDTFFE